MRTFTMNSLGVMTEVHKKPDLNAYELATALDEDWADIFREEAAIMLRMQADEITALRSQLNELL